MTEAGRSFKANAKKLLRQSEEAIRKARELGGLKAQTIRIGTSMMRPATPLVELWESIDGKYDVQFSVVSFHDGSHGLSEMLNALGDTVDCFVSPCGSTVIFMNYNFQPFGSCKFALPCPASVNCQKRKSSAGRIWRVNHYEGMKMTVKAGITTVLANNSCRT